MISQHIRHPLLATLLCSGAVLLNGCNRGGGDEHAGQDHGDDGHSNVEITPASHTHEVEGETCFICDASKREPGRLWCGPHSRYEDRCWLCHPELEDESRLYCAEHGLYEDECFLCHPELKDADGADDAAGASNDNAAEQTGDGDASAQQVSQATSDPGLFCNEHGVYERECAICHPELANGLIAGESLKIRMPSAESAQLAGVETGLAPPHRATPSARVLAEVRYNGNRLAKVTPLAGGVILDVRAKLGEAVQPGDVLAELTSQEIARAKGAYLSALAEESVKKEAFDRHVALQEENISARRDYQEAQAAHRLAQLNVRRTHQELLNLGFTETEVTQIADSLDSSSTLLVRAPFAGCIIARNAVVGEAVEMGAPLFELADLSTVWLELAVPETLAASLQTGMPVTASLRAIPGRTIEGELVWVGPTVDVHTRMVRARAEVPNEDGLLRNGMFAEVLIQSDAGAEGLGVPRDSVQMIDNRPYVFVRVEPDLYAARRVEVFDDGSDVVTVLAGLNRTEPVVVKGGFTMKSEFLKSRLGAGCTDH